MYKSIKTANKAISHNNKIEAISLFSGAGGMDKGFADAGINVAAAVEKWEPACETHRKNFPDTKLFEGDITSSKVKDAVVEYLKERTIDIVFGGPPCTGFSLLGLRNPNAPCNYLFRDYLEIVNKIRPVIFALENVEGILSMPMKDGSLGIEAIIEGALKIGYRTEYRLLMAADYGVPQLRKRVILIGTRFDVPIQFPKPTHGPEGSGLKPYVTIREAIGDLEQAPEDEEFSHVFTQHSSKLLSRIKATKQGKALYARNHGSRLDPEKQAATLTNNNGSTVVHYLFDRMITPRECARIQGFPDNHLFCGCKNDVGKQVGNALPPPMAKAVAVSMLEMLDAIKHGASDFNAQAATVVPSLDSDGETLKSAVEKLREGCVGKINTEKKKIDAATGRVDSFYLRIGKYVAEFIAAATAKGESRKEDYFYKYIVKGGDCNVQKGALYNASNYYLANREMTDKFGEAPDCPMTYYVKVRHKALTIDEQRDLLLQAKANPKLKTAELNSLVAEKLKEKGLGRKEPAPDAQLIDFCKKVLSALTQVNGLLKKNVVPSPDAISFMSKNAAMANACLKQAGLADGKAEVQKIWNSGDASRKKAS